MPSRRSKATAKTVSGLDSQQFWYELLGTADDAVRRDSEEARAQVDLFVASVASFTILALLSAVVAVVLSTIGPLVLSLLSAAFVPIAHRGAVRNMKDWNNSVRALVTLGRLPMAERLGLETPRSLDLEKRMWRSFSGVMYHRMDVWRPWLDVFRRGTEIPDSPAEDTSGRPGSSG